MRWLLACLLAVSAHGATIGEWRQDIDAIVADVRTFHPAPFTKTGQLTFQRRVEALKDALPAMTEEQRVAALMRTIALIGDGHTQLYPQSALFAGWYPVRMYEFQDGVFITTAHKSVADLAGALVLEIAHKPIADVLRTARELNGCDNTFDCEERIVPAHNSALMRALGFAAPNGDLTLRVRISDGKVVDRVLSPVQTNDASAEWRYKREVFGTPIGEEADWITAYRGLAASAFRTYDAARPPHFTIARRFFTRAMPERDAYYIQSYGISDEFGPEFVKALEEIDRTKPRRVIVDLRYNFGGDGSVIPPVIHDFIRREASPPWKELYLITGRKTFSAGVMAAVALIDNCALSVIGEPPGAARNSYGDATERPYPRIGVTLFVSTLRHDFANSNDVRDTIAVDVPAPFTFAQWRAGDDPAVDPILRGDEMRSIATIARAVGGGEARRVYAERKARYANLGWFEPPRELDLRDACHDLLAKKRIDDALETCKLNAEIHPFIWNTWLNLASAQSRAGLYADRLVSLHRVLEIDPNNFNGDVIKEALEAGLRPPVVRFGSTVVDVQKSLDGMCTAMNVREVKPPFLDNVKLRQMQIDCEGFPFLGAGRHAEFVFRDDALVMTWIMTTPQEKDAIAAAMRTAYPEQPLRNANYEAFIKAKAALREKPAEVLFYSPEVIGDVEPDFHHP